MQHYAKLCNVMQTIMQCYANDYAMLCNIMQCYAKLCNIMQHQNYTKYKSNGGEQHLINAFRSLFVVQVATMRRRPPPPPRHAHVQPAATKTSWTASPTLTRCQWQHILRSTSTRKTPPERAWGLVQVDGEEGRQPANLYQTLSKNMPCRSTLTMLDINNLGCTGLSILSSDLLARFCAHPPCQDDIATYVLGWSYIP